MLEGVVTPQDLRVGQVWVNLTTGTERKIIHVATAGCGDSVAWRDRDWSPGGGSAKEFVAAHACRVTGWMEPERCGCDESKALRARMAQLEGQISGMRESLPFRDAAMRDEGARSHLVRRGA